MRSTLIALSAIAAHQVTGSFVPPPPPGTLTETKSGVLPTLPTPFPSAGILTNQGAITNKGAPQPGYVGLLGPAEVQSNLPKATYAASLPQSQPFNELTGTIVIGSIIGTTSSNGTGVNFTVNFSGFPDVAKYGPFKYHIHNSRVPDDGNCTSALAHFDTTNRGEYYPCVATEPQNCQTGDLSGKHAGTINATSYQASYVDLYLSTDPSSPYFFGDKSIVVHTSNATRITCANFAQAVEGGSLPSSNSTSGSGSSSGSGSGATYGSNSTVTAGATRPSASATSTPIQGNAGVKNVVGGMMVSVLVAVMAFVM